MSIITNVNNTLTKMTEILLLKLDDEALTIEELSELREVMENYYSKLNSFDAVISEIERLTEEQEASEETRKLYEVKSRTWDEENAAMKDDDENISDPDVYSQADESTGELSFEESSEISDEGDEFEAKNE